MKNIESYLPTEYKVREVTRFVLTSYEPFYSQIEGANGTGVSRKVCEFESYEEADKIQKCLTEYELARVARVEEENTRLMPQT